MNKSLKLIPTVKELSEKQIYWQKYLGPVVCKENVSGEMGFSLFCPSPPVVI